VIAALAMVIGAAWDRWRPPVAEPSVVGRADHVGHR
jgi:hypothetical protein